MRRRAPVLSDDDWSVILEEASPPPGANLKKARRELEACLRDHPRFMSRGDLADLRARWRRIKKAAANLHGLVENEWDQRRWRYNPLVDDGLVSLWQSAEALTEGLDMLLLARKGRRDPVRELFYWRVFGIWTDQLDGKLSASSTPTGGPLVRFVRHIGALVGVIPSVSTVRALIKAERRARRGRGISSRKK